VIRKLVAPAWLWRHGLAAAAFAGCVIAGRWQLDRAEASGAVLNWGYMVEWWTFAALGAFWWIRTVVTSPAPPSFHGRAERVAAEVADPVLAPRERARTVLETASADDSEDPALAAWNRRFEELAGKDRG
jgi:hypothetical protein